MSSLKLVNLIATMAVVAFFLCSCGEKKSSGSSNSDKNKLSNSVKPVAKTDKLTFGDSLLKIGEYDKALEIYLDEINKSVKDSSPDKFHNYQLAVIGVTNVLLKTRQFNEAIAYLDSTLFNYEKIFKPDTLFNSKMLYQVAFAQQGLGRDSVAISMGEKLIEPFEVANDSDYLNKTYWLIGISNQRKRDFITALDFYHMSNHILEKTSERDSAMLFKQYSAIFGVYGNLYVFDSALSFFNKTKRLSHIISQLKPQEKLKYYYNAANLFMRIDSYDEAITNCSEAVLNTSKELNSVLDVYPFYLIGQLHQENGDFEKSIAFSLRADSIFEILSARKEMIPPLSQSDFSMWCKVNMVLSACYDARKEHDVALRYARKALETGESKIPDVSDLLSEASFNLSHLYYYSPNRNSDSVNYYLNKSIFYTDTGNLTTLKPTIKLNIESMMALNYLDKGNFDESKKLCHAILTDLQNLLSGSDKNYLSKLIYPNEYAEALDKISDCYIRFYKESNDFSYLEKAEWCNKSQLLITNYSINNSDPLYAFKFLNSLNSPISKLLEINYEKKKLKKENLQKVAEIIENNKSVLLQQQKKQSIISNTAYTDARQQLSIQRTYRTILMEKGASEINADPTLKIEFIGVNKKIDSLNKIIYGNVLDNENIKLFSLDKYLKNLSHDVAILNFKCSDSSIFILNVSSNEINFNKVRLDSALNNKINRFQKLLNENQSSEDFILLADELCKALIIDNFPKAYIPKNLVIIPDNILNNIPFEALVTYRNGDSTRYLADDCNIRYEYCMDFILNKKMQENKNDGILAIAPKFEKLKQDKSENLYAGITKNILDDQPNLRAGVGPLQYNAEEVHEINSHYSGKELIDNDATEEAFRNNAKNYNVLHFATHAFSNADNPNLSGVILKLNNSDSVAGLNSNFEYNDSLLERDNILHAYEIQNMNLNADLVVLSACETNVGKYQAGEGAMSLARAFKYANCPNIVSSLWKVDDASTKEIIINFYDNLGKEMGKADALSEAKRKFRREHPNASPYYWAAFVLVGDNEPVHLDKKSSWVFWLSGGIAIVVIAAVTARKRKQKMSS